ncbi:uncharacterized protein LOC128734852 [Sabethes cyaneus]|uniref:uncharacterized protein LOC128734852 n=1 Tax=Sabethes cyaneus TaxID=53552 RepID=UPI00237E93FC|nr:uncharacterized protein LOC128734852 [Sabethes cyaneus]
MNDSAAVNNSIPRGILNATSYSLGDNTNAFEDSEICDDDVLQLMDKPFSQLVDGMQLRRNDRYAGFDNNAGGSWIYPTNYPVRKYQFSISQVALFKNTLVALPTGLGKTFIAAVVMYNFYRWYPLGKVIFMAPTKPLVAQQIEACYKIMGIPKEDTAEMTGRQNKKNRSTLWNEKRVFFVTPQVVQADMNNPESNVPIERIKLIVIDEAHKAKGHYAFVEVVKTVANSNRNFRVLALSATPGRTLQDVAEVVQNLLISHIEVRWENSIDVSPYTFRKNIRTIVIPLGPKLTKIRDEFIRLVDPYVRRLLDANVIYGHVGSLSSGWLLHQRKRFQAECLINRPSNYSTINSDFSACLSLYHGLELLVRHGIRAFLNYFDSDDGNKEKFFVLQDPNLRSFLAELREQYGSNPLGGTNSVGPMPNGELPKNAPGEEQIDFGHPKFDVLQRHLTEHFQNHPESKVIVFCEFRDSVAMIHRLLLQSRPTVRPKCIVGQGGSGSSAPLRAVTQKEQIAAMKDFRSGKFNTLIATCVVEEGIDVGEVDLIVCFDISKNHTRFVQRIGRTGRRRVGRALILVTEGKEHETLKEVLASKDKTNQQLSKSKDILNALYRQSPRMVPPEFDPKCVETFIKITDENVTDAGADKMKRKRNRRQEGENEASEDEASTTRGRGKKRKKDEAVRGTQDVRNFFRKADPDLDVNERQVFSTPPKDTSTDSANNTSVSFKIPVDGSIRLGKSEEEEAIEGLMKPLLRHKARLDRERYLNGCKLLCPQKKKLTDFLICPNPLKKLFYEADMDQLRTMVEKRNVLNSIVEDTEDDVIMLNDEGNCLKSELQVVESIFGGSAALKDRFEEIQEYQTYSERLKPLKEPPPTFIEEISEAQVSTFNELFEKFSAYSLRKVCLPPKKDNNSPDKSPLQADTSASNLFDSQFYLPAIIEPDNSSYVPPEPPPKLEKTPIRRVKSKSRLNELVKSEKRTPANLANSPLLRAFNRSVQKAKNSDFSSPISSRQRASNLSFQMVLEFFGLRELDQIFEDTRIDEQPKTFTDRLDAADQRNESVLETEHIAELSKSLFDCNELDLEAQEAAFLASEFSQEKIEGNPSKQSLLKSSSSEGIQLDGFLRTFSEEKSPVKPTSFVSEFGQGEVAKTSPKDDLCSSKPSSPLEEGIPLDEFLQTFSDDESPVKPTCSAVSNQSKKVLDLEIQKCLEDLIGDEMESPTNCESANSDEIIPSSQAADVAESKLKTTFNKNLDIGNLDDLFADSDDDLFGGVNDQYDGNDTDKTIEYDPKDVQSRKENSPNVMNREQLLRSETVLKTPSSIKNAATSNCGEDRSPSLLRKKLNFSRLRLAKPEADVSKLEVNSAPVAHTISAPVDGAIKSAFFASCQPLERDPPARVAELSRPLDVQFGFQRKLATADISTIFPRTKRKAIVSSSDSDEDEVFQTARSNIKSSSELKLSNGTRITNGPPVHRKRRKRKNNVNGFFLSQANVSDDGEDHQDDDDTEEDSALLEDDSIIHNGPVENDAVDMRAKYLQSVRSPLRRGGFKIPAAPLRQMNLLDIYSQMPDEHDQSKFYEECSFIVHENDEQEHDEVESELDELDRAEAILRERRRAKRKGQSSPSMPAGKRRRKFVRIGSDSEQSSDEGQELKAFRRQMLSGSDESD